uniref:Uncharacterized protein n=1 Tax=Knipowitschia caucasica TaxID=637954 RepID=A0AAV2L805_KNICA
MMELRESGQEWESFDRCKRKIDADFKGGGAVSSGEHIDPPVLQSAPGCAEHTTNNRNMPADRPCSTATENIPPASLSDHTTSTDCIITAHMDYVIRMRPASDHINKNSGDMENAGWIFACSALFQNISPLLN